MKNCTPFIDWMSKINNTQVDNVKDINVVIPMYKLIEYGDNYSKTLGSLWQYYWYVDGSSNDETNFLHKLLLTNTQVLRLSTGFANGLSANTKFSKTQLSKMVQSGKFLSFFAFGLPLALKARVEILKKKDQH